MNTYSTHFTAKCPINGIRILYALRIETTEVIKVEKIIEKVESFKEGFHEDFADTLFATFGGKQTMSANHHGVVIETVRQQASSSDSHFAGNGSLIRNGYF